MIDSSSVHNKHRYSTWPVLGSSQMNSLVFQLTLVFTILFSFHHQTDSNYAMAFMAAESNVDSMHTLNGSVNFCIKSACSVAFHPEISYEKMSVNNKIIKESTFVLQFTIAT